MENPSAFFLSEKDKQNTAGAAWHSQYQRWATIRAIYFLVGVAALVWFANERLFWAFGLGLVLFVLFFFALVRKHQKIRLERDMARILAKINEEESQRINGNLQGLVGGAHQLSIEHPYTNDLDVFGNNSLYQLLNRTTTPSGDRTLVAWLKQPAMPEEIIARQEAVQELAGQVADRQQWQALGEYHREEEASVSPLLAWVKEPNKMIGQPVWNILRWFLPALTITLYTLNAFGVISFGVASIGVVVNMVVLGRWFNYSMSIQKATQQSVAALRSYDALLGALEKHPAKSQRLRELQAPLLAGKEPASKVVSQLRKILDAFDSRANLVYVMANLLLVLDLHWIVKAERWRKNHQQGVARWFDVVGEWEVLSSLAGLAYAEPSYTMPTVSAQGYQLTATQLGHPLIPGSKRVVNDFSVAGKGKNVIITGSNMAGKSTFLRTVGLNAVLAQTGSVVCATSFSMSTLQVFTSMRTQDNLEESISSFFAELKRIRQLLDSLKQNEVPILYFLDEILKGTNSDDRHKGAAGLVKQLHHENALGLISTHDLALSQLENEVEGLENYSFNSTIAGQDIRFDYKLTAGKCQEFNAAVLMAKMGIQVDEKALK